MPDNTYTAKTRLLAPVPRSKRMRDANVTVAQQQSASQQIPEQTWNHDTDSVPGIDLLVPVAEPLVEVLRLKNGSHIVTISVDNSGYLHVDAGLYSDSFVSALGVSPNGGSGGGGMDLDSLWDALSTYDNEPSHVINSNYIPNLSGYLQKSGDTMTGSLVIATGVGISDASTNGMLVYKPTNWTGISSSQWGVGAIDCPGVIRTSGNNLYHYRNDTSSAQLILDSSNFNSYALPLSGGTMTGVLTLKANQYSGANGYGMNCNNSDLFNVNSIITSDNAESFGEGILFWRSSTPTYDCLTASGGTFYFGANKTYGASFAGDAKINSGRINITCPNEAYGIGSHYLGLDMYNVSHCSILLRNSSCGWGICSNNNGNFYIGRRASNSATTVSNDYYLLTINSSGFVGIGTTSPTGMLHIYQSAWSDGLVLQRSVASGGCGIKVLDVAGTQLGIMGINGSKQFQLTLGTSTIGIWSTTTLAVTGNITATGAVTALATSASDRRLKKDIKPFNARQIIDKLQPVEFRWNDEAHEFNGFLSRKELQHGLIAQDSDGIIDGFVFDLGNGTDYKGIHYEKLTPILLQAVKEQQEEIDNLKKELSELKDIVKQLIGKRYGSII